MDTEVSGLLYGVESGKLSFKDVIAHIDGHYLYSPIKFYNGETVNPVGTNEGSAKIFSFARLHHLSQLDTLKLFAEHYQAVLDNPNGTDHANIRNFMHYGWQGIGIATNALTPY